MDSKFETTLMVKVADMYYLRGLKQEEIARELNIARSTISVILNAAREAGIVEIRIRDPQLNHDALSGQIQALFRLPCCLVVPTGQQNSANQRKMIAQRAMQYFNTVAADGMTIGMAWGRTASALRSMSCRCSAAAARTRPISRSTKWSGFWPPSCRDGLSSFMPRPRTLRWLKRFSS